MEDKMRISARSEYACRALLELALHWPNKKPLAIRLISEKQHIPVKYLIHILIQLKRLGVVSSTRGKEGGYNLALAPGKILLGEVIYETSGPLFSATDLNTKNNSIFTSIWDEVELSVRKVLDKVTFADISDRARRIDKT